MKAPSPSDPFEMEATTPGETLRDRRRREERAEEKRCLYVACTRARDHLLLCGHHELADDAEGDSLANLAEADPDDASSYRDWVQPALLPDEVCGKLDEVTSVHRSYGDGAYTISIPTPKVERVQTTDEVDPTVELSPSPPVPDVTFQLSATDLASFLGGYGELKMDDDTRTIFVETTEESPDERHGEEEVATQESDVSRQEPESRTEGGSVSPRVFGEMVHRLCELRPPESRWLHLMEQTLVDEDADVELTSDLQHRVSKHAQRGIDYINEQTAATDVEHQYDELYVTAEFDRGEISGYIDHLILTPEEYHIVDYKTGAVTPEELEEDAQYYQNQMKAYAIALHQQKTERNVRVSLVFTEVDEVWETEWTTIQIESMQEEIQRRLLDDFPTVE